MILNIIDKIVNIGLLIGIPFGIIWLLNFVFALSIPVTVSTWAGFFVISLMVVAVKLHMTTD